jgi:ATP-dependent DNA ligase
MTARRSRATLPGTDLGLDELPAAQPRFVKKMDCISVSEIGKIPSGPEWFREIKWDGYRICVIKRGDQVALRTKSNQEPGARCAHIAESLSRSKLVSCVLDAELVALDPEGRPSFQLLQQSRRNRAPIILYVFDVLNYADRNLRSLPLETRRAVLDAIAPVFPQHLRLSELLPQDAAMERLVEALDQQKLEGIIVKRRSSQYVEGKTSGTWVKYRLYQIGEFIIGGYLTRQDRCFDALIVGERHGDALLYKEKVRFGFDDEKKSDLLARMEALRTTICPFDNLPEPSRRGSLSAEQMNQAVWVKPVLDCTVEYTERTESGSIRGHGRFGQLIH